MGWTDEVGLKHGESHGYIRFLILITYGNGMNHGEGEWNKAHVIKNKVSLSLHENLPKRRMLQALWKILKRNMLQVLRNGEEVWVFSNWTSRKTSVLSIKCHQKWITCLQIISSAYDAETYMNYCKLRTWAIVKFSTCSEVSVVHQESFCSSDSSSASNWSISTPSCCSSVRTLLG